MANSDTIKLKELHVNLLFYLEIINGFNLDVSLLEKKGKQPVVMPSVQSTYFKRRVLPIILKLVEKGLLLLKYYSSVYLDKKKSILQGLRLQFLKGFALLLNTLELIDLLISKSENHSPGVMKKITTIAKWYRRIKRILRNYQTYKRLGKATLTVGVAYKLSYFSNLAYRLVFAEEVKSHVTLQLDNLVEAFKGFMVPGLIAFRDVICDKLGSVWGKFWTSIIKMFLLPDTDDWVDTGLWLLGWTIQIGGYVASTVSGGAAGVLGTAANAGIQGARFVKAVTKVLNAIIRPLMKMMHPIVKYGRELSKSSSFLIRTTAKSARWFGRNVVLGAGKFRLGGKDRFNPNAWRKRIGAIRRRYNLSKKVIELIDLYNVDKSDVKAMLEEYRKKLIPVGERLQQKLTNGLLQVGLDIHFIEELANEVITDFHDVSIKIVGLGGYLKKFEKNFQQAFRITNAGKLDWMKTIRKLNNRLKRTFGSTFKKFTKKMFTKDYALPYLNYKNDKTTEGNAIEKTALQLTINIKPYNYRFSYKLGDSKFKMENLYGFWGNKNYKFSIFINAGNEIHLDNDEVIKALSSSKDRNGVVSLFTGMKRTLNDTLFETFSKNYKTGWGYSYVENVMNGKVKGVPKEITDNLKRAYKLYVTALQINGKNDYSLKKFYENTSTTIRTGDDILFVVPGHDSLKLLWNYYVALLVFSLILLRKDNTKTLEQLRSIYNQDLLYKRGEPTWLDSKTNENKNRKNFSNVDVHSITYDNSIQTGIWFNINSKTFPTFELYRTIDGKDRKNITSEFANILSEGSIVNDVQFGERYLHFPFTEIRLIKATNGLINAINQHSATVVDVFLGGLKLLKNTLKTTLSKSSYIKNLIVSYMKTNNPNFLELVMKGLIREKIKTMEDKISKVEAEILEESKRKIREQNLARQSNQGTLGHDPHYGDIDYDNAWHMAD